MTTEERVWFLIARSISGDISAAEAEELELAFLSWPELKADHDNIKRLKLDTPVAASIKERNALERGLQKLDYSLANEGRSIERHIFTNEPTPLSNKRPFWWMAAASLLILVTAGILTLRHTHAPAVNRQQQLVTHYGKRLHQILPDGSVVWLNSGSAITYADNPTIGGKREVTLKGEAYFDVKHDTDHPFIVHAGKLSIVVLGTAFNVKAYDGDAFTETTLIRGKVEIINKDQPDKPVILAPNEKVVMSNLADASWKTKLAVKHTAVDSLAAAPQLPDNAIVETAWVSDQLSFKRENFSDLAKQLERWYNVEINFENNTYLTRQFTGTFKGQAIDEVMHDLQLIEPFHYRIKNNQIQIW